MLYLDTSALVKRYVEEDGSALVRDVMDKTDVWFMCRIGFVETARALGLTLGNRGTATFRREWTMFEVIEVDRRLAEYAADLALSTELRSFDAIHLAAALLVSTDDITFATWDRRLHRAAQAHRLRTLPEALPA